MTHTRRVVAVGCFAALAMLLCTTQLTPGRSDLSRPAGPPPSNPAKQKEVEEQARRRLVELVSGSMMKPLPLEEALKLRPTSTVPDPMNYHRLLASEDVNVALRYVRQCPVQVRHPRSPSTYDLNNDNLTIATHAVEHCLRLGDFLDSCDDRRPPVFDGPAAEPPIGEWHLQHKCAWRAGVEPLAMLAGGKRVDLARWRGMTPTSKPPPLAKPWTCVNGKRCSVEQNCACWVHSSFRKPVKEHSWDMQVTMDPRVGGRFAQWDSFPGLEDLFSSTEWAHRALQGKLFLMIGHSHARALFNSLSAVVRDAAVDHGQHADLRYLEDGSGTTILTVDGAALALYLPAASPAMDDLMVAVNLIDQFAPRDGSAQLRRLVIVVCRGMWDLENADDGPHHSFLTHAHFLVRLRRAFPVATIFNYNTHFVHSFHGGCMSALRQVVTRDAVACAVNNANLDSDARVETFDVFDLTATRRVYFASLNDFAGAAYLGQHLAKLNQTYCNRRLVEVMAKKPLLRLMPLAEYTAFTTIHEGRYFAPVSDGHHYDAPVMLNIVMAFLIQVEATLAEPTPLNFAPLRVRPSFSRGPLRVSPPALANTTCRRCYEGMHTRGGLFCLSWCESLRRRAFVTTNATDAFNAAVEWATVNTQGKNTREWLNRTFLQQQQLALNQTAYFGDVCDDSGQTSIAVQMGVEVLKGAEPPSNSFLKLRLPRTEDDLATKVAPRLPDLSFGHQWVAVRGCAWPSGQRFVFHGPFHRVIVPLVVEAPPATLCWRHNAVPEAYFVDTEPLRRAFMSQPPRILLMGHSHLRFAFASLVGVLHDARVGVVAGSDGSLVQIFPVEESDFTVLCVRRPGVTGHSCNACLEPVMVYYPTPVPSAADLQSYYDMATNGHGATSSIPSACLIHPSDVSLFVTSSGLWETQNAAPRQQDGVHVLRVVQSRLEAFLDWMVKDSWLAASKAGLVFQLPPSSHIVGGCLAPERLLRLRETLIAAIARVNTRWQSRIAVWDLFSMAHNRNATGVNVSAMPLVSAFELGRSIPDVIGVGDRVHVDVPAHLSATLALLYAMCTKATLETIFVDNVALQALHGVSATPVVVTHRANVTLDPRPFNWSVGSCSGCFERPDFRLWTHTWCAVLRRREARLGCRDVDGTVTVNSTAFAAVAPMRAEPLVEKSIVFLRELQFAVEARSACPNQRKRRRKDGRRTTHAEGYARRD